MEVLYKTHRQLVEHARFAVRRRQLDLINADAKLTAITGARGTGKTSLLLAFARENYRPSDKRCLYVNLDNLSFAFRPLHDFAEEFVRRGGQVLLLDSITRCTDWPAELAFCLTNLPELKIIFTAPSAVRFDSEQCTGLAEHLETIMLGGFSFREYLALTTSFVFQAYPLNEILENHQQITAEISAKIKPLAFFDDYLERGFYPFFNERRLFSESVLRAVGQTIDADMTALCHIDPANVNSVRRLLYILATHGGSSLNISYLSTKTGLSRITATAYIRALDNAGLVRLLRPNDVTMQKSPSRVYIENVSLLYVLNKDVSNDLASETFFCNCTAPFGLTIADDDVTMFCVAENYLFCVGDKIKGKFNPDCYYAISGIEAGERRVIPLWLFGFLS